MLWIVGIEHCDSSSRQLPLGRESELIMATRSLDRAAELVGDVVGTVGGASEIIGSRARQGLDEAASAVSQSDVVESLEESLDPARKAIKRKVRKAKKVVKRQRAIASATATGAKKTAKKRASTVRRKATGAKKTAKKRASTVRRKATGAKKTAKKRASTVRPR
jgi:hypothetical protein